MVTKLEIDQRYGVSSRQTPSIIGQILNKLQYTPTITKIILLIILIQRLIHMIG